MNDMGSPRGRDGMDMPKFGEEPKRNPPVWMLMLILVVCVGTITLAVKWGVDARKPAKVEALGPPAAPPARPAVAPAVDAATAAEKSAEAAEDDKRFRKGEMTMQVRVLLCEESADRYMKARTGVEFQRQIQISEANGCGWQYIMAADAKTHGLTKEALKAAADIEPDDVPAADGGAAATADQIEGMKRQMSESSSEIERLRYRTNYR